METNPVVAALSSLTLGPEVTFQNLTMVPLVDACTQDSPFTTRHSPFATRRSDYVLLDDALEEKLAEVTEISEHGSVPELRVRNRASSPLLVVDGQELVGAKQNRVVNLTILVPANADLTIPVSCVEAGRWKTRSRTFKAAPRAQYATGRARRMSQVTASMVDRGAHHSDQARVWSDIAEKCARLGASSPTSAMEAMYVDHAATIDRFVAAMRPVEAQVGAVFVVSGDIVGLDAFDRPATLRRMLPKLVRSVAIEAIDRAAGEPVSRRPVVSASASGVAAMFVAALTSAKGHKVPAIGLGEDVRLTAPALTGAALVADGGVVHLSGFAL